MIKGSGRTMAWLHSVAVPHTGETCLLWPFARSSNGRGVTWRAGKSVDAHVVVCEALYGPRPSAGHDAAHTCGKGHMACVSGAHVVWKTKRENAADRRRHGTHIEGEAVKHKAKLTKEQAAYVRNSTARGVDLAAQFGITPAAVCAIRKGRNWRSACA